MKKLTTFVLASSLILGGGDLYAQKSAGTPVPQAQKKVDPKPVGDIKTELANLSPQKIKQYNAEYEKELAKAKKIAAMPPAEIDRRYKFLSEKQMILNDMQDRLNIREDTPEQAKTRKLLDKENDDLDRYKKRPTDPPPQKYNTPEIKKIDEKLEDIFLQIDVYTTLDNRASFYEKDVVKSFFFHGEGYKLLSVVEGLRKERQVLIEEIDKQDIVQKRLALEERRLALEKRKADYLKRKEEKAASEK
jgi:HPt (histidine-containing phosphotransfer) domain-containing protein